MDFLSKRAQSITPYTAGFQPKTAGVIKLNTNENPYPPSPKAIEAFRSFSAESLRLYPKADGGQLRAAAASINGIPQSHVFCGNGSDEVLAFAFAAFFDGGIIFPDVTYSFYPVWAQLFSISYNLLPLNGDFTISVEQLRGNGVVLANPNAPTGIALSLEEVEQVLRQNAGSVVIVDEAYSSFGAQSAVPLIQEYDNLLVVTTLSKSHSLAGLRVSYALGQPHLIEGLERIKDSFNSYPVDSAAQAMAAAALLDTAYAAETAKKITATRERISSELLRLGFTVTPSKANFLFVSKPGTPGEDIKAYLEQNGIYVRHWNKPRISGYLRISVGTDEQMDTLVKKLSEFVNR